MSDRSCEVCEALTREQTLEAKLRELIAEWRNSAANLGWPRAAACWPRAVAQLEALLDGVSE